MTSTDPRRHGPTDDNPTHNPDVDHEDSDIDFGIVLKVAAGLALTVVVCALIVRAVFGELSREARARDPKLSPLACRPRQRLVLHEPQELHKFRAEEDRALAGYGWIDQIGGVTHIPIAEAKKLLAGRGLPVRADASSDTTEGTHRPAYGEASGGRNIK